MSTVESYSAWNSGALAGVVDENEAGAESAGCRRPARKGVKSKIQALAYDHRGGANKRFVDRAKLS
jgi:hypothetical protein